MTETIKQKLDKILILRAKENNPNMLKTYWMNYQKTRYHEVRMLFQDIRDNPDGQGGMLSLVQYVEEGRGHAGCGRVDKAHRAVLEEMKIPVNNLWWVPTQLLCEAKP